MRSTLTPPESQRVLWTWDKLHAAARAVSMDEYDIVQLELLTWGDVYILLADIDRRLNRKERGVP